MYYWCSRIESGWNIHDVFEFILHMIIIIFRVNQQVYTFPLSIKCPRTLSCHALTLLTNRYIHIYSQKTTLRNHGEVITWWSSSSTGKINLQWEATGFIERHKQWHGWVTVTTNRSYHQPRWRRPKTVRPNNRGYQENLTVRCAHMTLTCRCHITLCISAMTMCFSSAGSENLHLEIFRKLVVTVRPCWS